MIPSQFDYSPGLDLSPLTTATLAQITQAISQIAPLSNVGGVLHGTATPTIADNARYERYIWLDDNFDPPTPKYYNVAGGTWDAIAVSAATIGPTQLAAHCVMLDHFFNATVAVPGQANKILRYDSGGDLIEAATLATILAANSVPLTAIDKSTATDKQILQYRSSDGLTLFRTVTPTDLFAAASFGLSMLSLIGDGKIIQQVGGVMSAVAEDVFMGGAAAPVALQVPQRNIGNSDTIWTTPIISLESTAKIDGSSMSARAGTAFNIAHGLATTPKLVRVVGKCIINDATPGYLAGDIVEADAFINSVNNIPVAVLAVDATNITLGVTADITFSMMPKTGGNRVAVTEANWNWGIYAYA